MGSDDTLGKQKQASWAFSSNRTPSRMHAQENTMFACTLHLRHRQTGGLSPSVSAKIASLTYWVLYSVLQRIQRAPEVEQNPLYKAEPGTKELRPGPGAVFTSVSISIIPSRFLSGSWTPDRDLDPSVSLNLYCTPQTIHFSQPYCLAYQQS